MTKRINYQVKWAKKSLCDRVATLGSFQKMAKNLEIMQMAYCHEQKVPPNKKFSLKTAYKLLSSRLVIDLDLIKDAVTEFQWKHSVKDNKPVVSNYPQKWLQSLMTFRGLTSLLLGRCHWQWATARSDKKVEVESKV